MLNTQNTVFNADQAAKTNLDRMARVLAVSFARECGFRPLPWMERGFRGFLDEGFEYQMLVEVIAQTSRAPRPSWAYLEAILRRCRSEDVYRLLDFISMPHREKDRKYRENNFFKDIPEDILMEAVENFQN